MTEKNKTLLEYAGDLATAARMVAGGNDPNGFYVPPASLLTASADIAQLRRVLDEYDRAVLEAPVKRDLKDPFGDTKYITAYPTKMQAQAYLNGLRDCGVTSPFIIHEQPDRYSATGVWFQILRKEKTDDEK